MEDPVEYLPADNNTNESDSWLQRLMPGAEPFVYEAGEVGCLMVHGFTSTPFEMRRLGGYLAERGITATGMLLAGHGTSPAELAQTTWRDWYASVTEALDEMLRRCKRVYLAGLSLGAALTLYTAAHRGSDLAGIVSMSSPIYLPPGVNYALRGLHMGVQYLNKPYRDIENEAAKSEHVSYDQSSVAATASLVEFLAEVRGALPQVKVPTLVIYARHDHVVPSVSSHYIYSRLGTHDKKMVALHNGFHIVTVDTDRERVFESIYSFISEHEGGHGATEGRTADAQTIIRDRGSGAGGQ